MVHFELELYINAWLVAGVEIEQSVSAANVDDLSVENVALTHFVLLEFYCNIWFVESDDIDKVIDKVLIDGNPLPVNIPALDK